MKRMSAAFMAGLLLISTSASAQVKPGTHQLGVSLGGANPLSDDDIDGERPEFGALGPALGFSYLYQARRRLALGADLNFKHLGDKDIRTGQGPVEIESTAWSMLAIARGELAPDSAIRPYGMLGLGFGGVQRVATYTESPRFNREQTSGGLAFAMGGGVDFDVAETWLAGAELRYNYIDTRVSEIGVGSVRILDLLFKVGYKF